jgi:four helix bundle protein
MRIERFEDIKAWQEARYLVKLVYAAIKGNIVFRRDLRLVSQVQAAAVSCMANIAEGFSRQGDKEFIQFLFIAKSSAAEVQSHLYVALDQGYLRLNRLNRLNDSSWPATLSRAGRGQSVQMACRAPGRPPLPSPARRGARPSR